MSTNPGTYNDIELHGYRWTEPYGQWSHAAQHHIVEFGPDGSSGELTFQDGPIPERGVNGTTNEAVLQALIDRLRALNTPPYACRENSLAITHLEEALHWLWTRTLNRQQRHVEGTAEP
jgi:hypothetical protein